jgi:RNA polymerase sigma factor (sigma-70 family)
VSPRISIRLLGSQSDERLVKLVREGHERAFDALVHRYRRPLLRYCRRLGLSDARAEDAVQLAILNAWLALDSGTEVRELKPWLYRIAHNGAINAQRGSSERTAALSEAVSASGAGAVEEDLDRRIAVCDALAEVASLPPMQRRALVLTAIDGKSHDEVAGLLGVNQDAVRGLLYRARTTLRSAAAFTPQPLITWAACDAGTDGATTGRLPELAAGGGALGLGGVLIKTATVAITAGAMLGGAAVVRQQGARGHDFRTRALAGAVTSHGVDPAFGVRGETPPQASAVSTRAAAAPPRDRMLPARTRTQTRASIRAANGSQSADSSQGSAFRAPAAEPVRLNGEPRAGDTRPGEQRLHDGAETGVGNSQPVEGDGSPVVAPRPLSREQQRGDSSTATAPAGEVPAGVPGGTDETAAGPAQPPSSGERAEAPQQQGPVEGARLAGGSSAGRSGG